MLFELDPRNNDFSAHLNGETPREISQIAAALSYLSVEDVLPPPADKPDPKIIVGRLAAGRGLFDAEFMIKGALNGLSDWERSSQNPSLVFTHKEPV